MSTELARSMADSHPEQAMVYATIALAEAQERTAAAQEKTAEHLALANAISIMNGRALHSLSGERQDALLRQLMDVVKVGE